MGSFGGGVAPQLRTAGRWLAVSGLTAIAAALLLACESAEEPPATTADVAAGEPLPEGACAEGEPVDEALDEASVCLDAPGDGEELSGQVEVRGYAADPSGNQTLAVTIRTLDGSTLGEGTATIDASQPGYLGAFVTTLDVASVSEETDAVLLVRIEQETEDGDSVSDTRDVTVVAPAASAGG